MRFILPTPSLTTGILGRNVQGEGAGLHYTSPLEASCFIQNTSKTRHKLSLFLESAYIQM